MKRYQKRIHLITATLLITLPWLSYANLCNEQEWNKALVSQGVIDSEYNLLANKYNQWLPGFQESIFLHKEFSLDELQYLWDRNSNNFRNKVDKQIIASVRSEQLINEFSLKINSLPVDIRNQIDNWLSIEKACKAKGLVTNQVATAHYVKADQQLIEHLSKLEKQINIMNRYYSKEIDLLHKIQR